MRRGLSNPTRPSLPGPHRVPRISTEVRSASVMRMSSMSAPLTPTAFQEECSRRDTLSVTMRPLVSLPIYPDFSEFLTGMNSPASRLNMVTRMGSNVEVADFVTVAMRFANQHLAHVPPIAAGQTTSAEPRHQPAVAPGVSEATWPRPSTANDRRLTRVVPRGVRVPGLGSLSGYRG